MKRKKEVENLQNLDQSFQEYQIQLSADHPEVEVLPYESGSFKIGIVLPPADTIFATGFHPGERKTGNLIIYHKDTAITSFDNPDYWEQRSLKLISFFANPEYKLRIQYQVKNHLGMWSQTSIGYACMTFEDEGEDLLITCNSQMPNCTFVHLETSTDNCTNISLRE